MEMDNKDIIFPEYCLSSNGYLNEEYEPVSGRWSISEYPIDFPEELKDYAQYLVNENIEHGCCGGCS